MTQDVRDQRLLGNGSNDPERAASAHVAIKGGINANRDSVQHRARPLARYAQRRTCRLPLRRRLPKMLPTRFS